MIGAWPPRTAINETLTSCAFSQMIDFKLYFDLNLHLLAPSSTCVRTMPITPTPPNVLKASLEQHNETFENLLRLIPAQYYIVNEQKMEEQVYVDAPTLQMFT